MNTSKLSTLIAAFLALAVLASACGGDDASASDQVVIDAVAQAIRDEGGTEGLDVDCMAGSMVTNLGGAEVMESQWGLTPETIADGQDVNDVELPRDQAISMADGMMDCGIVDLMVSEITGDGVSEDDANCLVEKMDQDALRDTFAAEFMNDADADAVGEAAEQAMFGSLLSAVGDCGIDMESLGF